MVTKFEITGLGVIKLQKKIPKCRITCHTLLKHSVRRHKLVADQKILLNTINDSHNSNFTNIVLPSLKITKWRKITLWSHVCDHLKIELRENVVSRSILVRF